MRNFFAAVGLVIIGTATNKQLQPAATPAAVVKETSNASVATVSSKERKYPSREVSDAKRVLIATIPDPKLTKLSLHFDRWMESLQRAAEASGYVLKQQWIPWTTNETAYDEPGVLLFQRKAGERLAVLLVGESPVAGISEAQFKRALADGGQYIIGIVGPSFSGGFQSLRTQMEGLPEVPVASGSATNIEAICDFASNHPFRATVDPDTLASRAFEGYLKARGVSFRKSATLAEGDTTYGAGDASESVRVTFPRDLSVLRRAYESDQQLRKSISQAGENVLAGSSVSIQRSEDGTGRDSVPVQSPGATAATQELAVQAVARRLDEDRVALASILATNTLDVLFLRQYMAARVPDMQFILFEPDLLFSHVPEVYAFQGTLAVSRYPLTLAQGARLVAFPSKSAEGVYWAARSVLGLAPEVKVPSKMRLSMIGFDGYWPVADLQGDTADEFKFLPPKTYVAIWSTLAAALLFALCALWSGQREANRGGAPRKWFADFIFDRDAPMAYAREHHFYCLVLGVVAILLLLTLPLEASWGKWAYLPVYLCIAVLTLSVPMGKDIPSPLQSWWLDTKIYHAQRKLTPALTISITLLMGTFVWVLYRVVWMENDFGGWSRFAAYRSIYLTNGVNPTLPLLLMGLSILACAWYHFQRTIFASERFVPLDLCMFGTLEGPYLRVRDILGGYGTLPSLLLAALAGGIVVAVASIYRSALTIEGRIYDIYVILLLAVSAAFTMFSVCQFLQVWWHFSDFLRGLEVLPVRHVFTKLPQSLGTVALFNNSPRSRSYVYLLRCRDCLRLLPSTPKWMMAGIEESTNQLLIRTGKDERETGAETMRAQLSMLYPFAYLIYHLQRQVWWKGESDLQPKKDRPAEVALAEEFVALRFLGFIRYTVLQLRNLLTLFSVSFILQAMAVSCYPFFSQSLSQMYIGVAFAVLSVSIGYVLAQLSRDAIMHRLSTDPATGTSKDHPFLTQALQSASLPLLAFASTYFPDLGRMLFSWVGPLASAAGK